MDKTTNSPARPMSGLQKAAIAAVVLVLVASVAARMLLGDDSAASPNPMPAGARSFAEDGASKAPETAGWLRTTLPVVTEASLFALIGFALGYTTRKAFKLLLILIALAFVGVQILVARGTIEVDWGGLAGAIQTWVLNLSPDVPVAEFLKARIPTAAAFVAFWLLGFRRG